MLIKLLWWIFGLRHMKVLWVTVLMLLVLDCFVCYLWLGYYNGCTIC